MVDIVLFVADDAVNDDDDDELIDGATTRPLIDLEALEELPIDKSVGNVWAFGSSDRTTEHFNVWLALN